MAEDRTALREGRLKRWSRLKRGGGGDKLEAPAEPLHDDEYATPDPHALPGGAAARRGATVPAMASLVRDEGDDEGETETDAGLAAPTEDAAGAEEMPALTPEEEAVVRELPPIDSLTKDSDFTPFLADKVPEFIRRRALAVLWRSDPVLANLDGLNDYDLDYRVIDTIIDAAKDTVYRAGKGYARDDEEEAVAEETADAEQPEMDELVAETDETEASAEAGEAADPTEPEAGELPKSVDSDGA